MRLAMSLGPETNDGDLARAMSEEAIRLFEELHRSERRSRTDARIAAEREERVRQQLAYRLGTTLVADLRHPRRWLRLPLDLLRTVRGWKADKAGGRLAPPAPAGDDLFFARDRVAFVPDVRWQQLALPEATQPLELWATPLTASAASSVVLTFVAPSEAARAELLRLPGAGSDAQVTSNVELRLAAGVAVRLFKHGGARTSLQLRRRDPSGTCLLKLELRRPATRGDSAAAALHATPTVSIDPPPMVNAILWQAAQLAAEGPGDRAIRFAERHARTFVQPAISLLKANQVVGDDHTWLRHVNDYVRQFAIAAIDLDSAAVGDAPLFARLLAPAAGPTIEHGPVVSVLMPAFQARDTIAFAVRSILAQTWRPLELIVIDDCSSDGTWNILRELAASDPRVKLLRNEANVGPYVSKNLALGVATGAYITGHDADDWAHPQRLERHVGEVLRAGGAMKVSMTRRLRVDEHGRFVHFDREGKASDDGALRDAAMSCLFDAALMRDRLGYWDSVRFGADTEMIERARLVCGAGFVKLRQLAMLCLDAETSLTNDPTHGVSKRHGLSPTRAFYRDQWVAWHRGLEPAAAVLPFPHTPRQFVAPDAAAVAADAIRRVLAAYRGGTSMVTR